MSPGDWMVLLGGLAVFLALVLLAIVVTAVYIEWLQHKARRARQKRAWKKVEREWRKTVK